MFNIEVNQPAQGLDYYVRPGVYGLIENTEGDVAVIQTPKGYFLPGGGLEEGEDHEECLMRECIEEVGMKVQLMESLGKASYYFFSTIMQKPMKSEGYFYRCAYQGIVTEDSEDAHDLVWMDPKEAARELYLDNQKYAVYRVMINKRSQFAPSQEHSA